MNFKNIIVTFHIICFLIYSPAILAGEKFCDILIINDKNEKVSLRVEVARFHRERQRGLMFRKHLGENHGMLFIFAREKHLNFWMKHTYIPLSIAFINKEGIISEIQQMEPFQTYPSYLSKEPAMYAIEVNRGWYKKHNISRGSKVIFNGCISK
jgi:uncharacterized protein